MENPTPDLLEVDSSQFWNEIEEKFRFHQTPEICSALQNVVYSHVHKAIPTEISDVVLRQFKHNCPIRRIKITTRLESHPSNVETLTIMAFVPHKPNTQTRQFLYLSVQYPGEGKNLSLDELP